MNWDLMVGSAAALASMTSFAPQAWRIIKSRDANAISAGAYALTVTAFVLWVAYGVMREEWPLIVTNSVCLALAGFILAMKLLPRASRETVASALDPDTDDR